MGKHVRPLSWRNFRCREYDRCLSEAAKEDTDLNCSGCPLQDDSGLSVSSLDVEGCKLLLKAIFHPEEYKALQKKLKELHIQKGQHRKPLEER